MLGRDVHSTEDLETIHQKQTKTFSRPNSAKPNDFHVLNKHKTGPILLTKAKPNKNSNEKYTNDLNLLNKLKPRQINIDKERLYEENLEIKLKNNGLKEEIIKLKTKVQQIEKELQKKDDFYDEKNFSSIKPPNMIFNLKQTIKELKALIVSKDEEIERLNKNLKSTKINELESEIQAYCDECTRLRHHLDASLRQFESLNLNSDKNIKNFTQIDFLLKENQELLGNLNNARAEIEKFKQKNAELQAKNKKNASKKGEIMSLKQEIQKTKAQNEQIDLIIKDFSNKENSYKEEINKIKKALKDQQTRAILAEQKEKQSSARVKELEEKLKKSNFTSFVEEDFLNPLQTPSKTFFSALEWLLKNNNLTLENLWSIVDHNKSGTIEIDDFLQSLQKFNFKLDKKLIISVSSSIVKNEKFLDLEEIEKMFKEFLKNKANCINFETPVRNNIFEKLVVENQETKENISGITQEEKTKKNSIKNNQKLNLELAENEKKIKKESLSSDEGWKKEKTSKDEQKKLKKPKKNKKSSEERLSLPKKPLILDTKSKDILSHIAYRMQINRLPKSKLIINLFGLTNEDKQIGKSDLISFFQKHPFNFNAAEDQETLSSLLLSSKVTVKSISELLLEILND